MKRDATAVGIGEEVVGYIAELPPTYEKPDERLGLEVGSWRDVAEVVAGVVVLGGLWLGIIFVLAALAVAA